MIERVRRARERTARIEEGDGWGEAESERGTRRWARDGRTVPANEVETSEDDDGRRCKRAAGGRRTARGGKAKNRN